MTRPGIGEAIDSGSSEPRELAELRSALERARAEAAEAREQAQRYAAAWHGSVARRKAIERAMHRLLDATAAREGYRPRPFVARMRALAALHATDPLDFARPNREALREPG